MGLVIQGVGASSDLIERPSDSIVRGFDERSIAHPPVRVNETGPIHAIQTAAVGSMDDANPYSTGFDPCDPYDPILYCKSGGGGVKKGKWSREVWITRIVWIAPLQSMRLGADLVPI